MHIIPLENSNMLSGSVTDISMNYIISVPTFIFKIFVICFNFNECSSINSCFFFSINEGP